MSTDASTRCVRVEELHDGMLWSVRLAAPRANILDGSMVAALTGTWQRATADPHLKAIVLSGEGDHFSYGASVEEHLPAQVGVMLERFHGLFDAMLDAAVPTLAAVRGQCLGGGLELAAVCHQVFAAPDARLGQPEIVLGVFAPVASAILAARVGQGKADDLCLSGRAVDAAEALSMGLVDHVADDPTAAALAWAERHLLPRSASSLRFAARAARLGFRRRFRSDIDDLTRLYLDELMETHDAAEGIRAFLEKREAEWRHA